MLKRIEWEFPAIDIDEIDAPDYARYEAENAITSYIQGKRREEQRAILNDWLAPFGWRVTSIPTARNRSGAWQ